MSLLKVARHNLKIYNAFFPKKFYVLFATIPINVLWYDSGDIIWRQVGRLWITLKVNFYYQAYFSISNTWSDKNSPYNTRFMGFHFLIFEHYVKNHGQIPVVYYFVSYNKHLPIIEEQIGRRHQSF